jgi:hypothetical protein
VGSNPTGDMDDCFFVCFVLSGRRLRDEVITRPEESYRLWRVVVCDQETVVLQDHSPRWVAQPEKLIMIIIIIIIMFLFANTKTPQTSFPLINGKHFST